MGCAEGRPTSRKKSVFLEWVPLGTNCESWSSTPQPGLPFPPAGASRLLRLLPLPGTGGRLRLRLRLGGLRGGAGLELVVLGGRDGLAWGGVGIAGGQQRGGHWLLGGRGEDLQSDTHTSWLGGAVLV